MGSGTSNSLGSIASSNAVRHVGFYRIWATVIFVLTLVLLVPGKAIPFTSENLFLTFLGCFFMLIATVAYGWVWLLRASWGMLAMTVLSALISLACFVSLIVA